jgi:HSP20 family protein
MPMGKGSSFDWPAGPIRRGGDLLFETWPPIDVCEAEGKCIILCEIAGMKEEDFNITHLDNLLTIAGPRQETTSDEILAYHCFEIKYGPFERQVFLPDGVRGDQIEASYGNGFLKITMPIGGNGASPVLSQDPPTGFFGDLRRLEEGINLLFNELGLESWEMGREPPTNIYETEHSLIMLCEIAGMREEDFEVTVEGNRLAISGARAALSFQGKVVYHRIEIHSGPFRREFFIPRHVDSEKIAATYQNGFLRIEMPKIEPSKEISVDS